MKYQLIIVMSSLFIMSCSSELSDLRNKKIRSELNTDSDLMAKEIINRTISQYGGIDKWKSIKKTELIYEDTWGGLIGAFFGPWPLSHQMLRHEFWNGTFNSELHFLNGALNGQSWERRQSKSYRTINGKSFEIDDFNVEFFLPTYQYLIELPYRIDEIPILKYYGDTTLNKQNYDLIFGTWDTLQPNENFDQYILWINKDSGLIDYFHYTVRAFGKGIKGTVNYSNFQEIEGIIIPLQMTITPKPNKGSILHEMKIQSVKLSYRNGITASL